MTQEQKDLIASMKKVDILYLIENLMQDGVIDFEEVAVCHHKALEKKLAEKESIISQADTCIFESVFTDSLGKPSDNAAMLRKLEWLAKTGQHNMEGIMDFIKNKIKNYDTNGRNEKVE